MNTPPALDEGVLFDALRAGWGFAATSVRYAAVGFGSHHWVATDRAGERCFVTVDDLAKVRVGGDPDIMFARLEAAFGTARALRDGGLEFVVAAEPDAEGRVLRRLSSGFSIAVFPFLEAQTPTAEEWRSDEERRAVIGLLGRLHRATAVAEGIAHRDAFTLPCRSDLTAALDELDQLWRGGPFSEPARLLLVRIRPELAAALELYDELVATVQADTTPWVITHGEPHAANVMWTADGPKLIDWDTTMVAPAARDLWMLEPAEPPPSRAEPALMLYRLWWDLAEIADYTAGFRRPHDTTDDTVASWNNLEHFAQLKEHWPGLLDDA